MGFSIAGRLSTGINKPHKNNIGNLKKFEKVCASNTSFADTAINKPNKAELTAIKITAITTALQLILLKLMKNAAKIIGTNALKMPNNIAPSIFANTRILILTGASNNLSKERALLSKVMVTASIEVVPNRTLIPVKPGSSSSQAGLLSVLPVPQLFL